MCIGGAWQGTGPRPIFGTSVVESFNNSARPPTSLVWRSSPKKQRLRPRAGLVTLDLRKLASIHGYDPFA